jgi:hypothetical protein
MREPTWQGQRAREPESRIVATNPGSEREPAVTQLEQRRADKMKCRRAREAGWELVLKGTVRSIRATYGVKEPYLLHSMMYEI